MAAALAAEIVPGVFRIMAPSTWTGIRARQRELIAGL
jgi:hypothetical protein